MKSSANSLDFSKFSIQEIRENFLIKRKATEEFKTIHYVFTLFDELAGSYKFKIYDSVNPFHNWYGSFQTNVIELQGLYPLAKFPQLQRENSDRDYKLGSIAQGLAFSLLTNDINLDGMGFVARYFEIPGICSHKNMEVDHTLLISDKIDSKIYIQKIKDYLIKKEITHPQLETFLNQK